MLDKEKELGAGSAAVVQGSWSLGQGFLKGLGNRGAIVVYQLTADSNMLHFQAGPVGL